jgi:hypothetical protein
LLVERSDRPSGVNATLATRSPWPFSTRLRPVATSQRRTVWSRLPEASHRLSGENATPKTEASWPWRRRGVAERTGHRKTSSPTAGSGPRTS